MERLKVKFTKDYGETFEKETTIECDTMDACFESLYKRNRHYRYINGWYYECASAEDQKRYREWQDNLSHDRSFSLYYGDGIVD